MRQLQDAGITAVHVSGNEHFDDALAGKFQVYDNVNLHQRVRHERGGKCVHGGKHSRAYSSIMCTCTCIMIHVSNVIMA